MPSTHKPVRALLKVELNLTEDGVMFVNPSVTVGAGESKVIFATPSVARDQYFSRVQTTLNGMLQLSINELQRAARASQEENNQQGDITTV